MAMIKAWAAKTAGGKLEPYEYDPGPLGAEDVEIAVEHCGICHSDMSLIDNEWGMTQFPFVPGHALTDRSKGFVGGFMHAANEYADVTVVGINSPDGVYGGSSRSWESKESFVHFMAIIVDDLRAKMPLDGVYLSLHGAMAVRGIPRPEAEIARRVRQVVGPHVPIAGSFDLHGNEDEQFLLEYDL